MPDDPHPYGLVPDQTRIIDSISASTEAVERTSAHVQMMGESLRLNDVDSYLEQIQAFRELLAEAHLRFEAVEERMESVGIKTSGRRPDQDLPHGS